MNEYPHSQPELHNPDAISGKGVIRSKVIADAGFVHAGLLGIACALARLAAREDAEEEVRAEKEKRGRTGSVDTPEVM
jgi:hypothetical protein